MKLKKLSKLQIRAEILAAIQHLYSYEDIPKTLQDKYVAGFKLIEDRPYIFEILIKELLKYDYKKSRIISIFILELGTLEQLSEILWSYVKDCNISDDIKDVITLILKGLGDATDPEEYLNYFQNPGETIEKETERLLEVSYINPEAQIDFMDFMFSLPIDGQKSLLQSLKEDYPGEYLANVLLTIFETCPDEDLKKVVLEIFGETKTSIGVPVLKNIYEFSTDIQLKKIAKKSLNTLKISGVDIDNPVLDTRGSIICKQSKISECYASCVDGMGNQGFIISRIKPSGDIIMFSVVINDGDGILDCFGFNGISKFDFGRIIEKFQENSIRVIVPPEYCRYKLNQAQEINKKLGLSLPYEFVAWRALIYDFPEFDQSIENLASKWNNPQLISQTENLYKFPGFKHWFLDDNDNTIINSALDHIIDQSIENREYFVKDFNVLLKWLEDEINTIIQEYFDASQISLFRSRLLDMAYLLDIHELPNFRNTASCLAFALTENNKNIDKIPFFRKFIKKTIYEGYVRFQYELTKDTGNSKLLEWNNKKVGVKEKSLIVDNSANDLRQIIDILEIIW